jgi:hypothetical protein
LDAEVDADVDAPVDADMDAAVDAKEEADFDSKAYSLMRNHFVHSRTSAKQKDLSDKGRSLRSDLPERNFNEECDDEAMSVTTTKAFQC